MIDLRGCRLLLKRSHRRLTLHSTAERPSFFLSFSHLLIMSELQQLHLRIKEVQEQESPKHATSITKQRSWWLKVTLISITFILSGQTTGTLLGRFYYHEGGNNIWVATLVSAAAFPILLIPLFLYRFLNIPSTTITTTRTTMATTTARPPPSFSTLAFVYISLGLLMAGDNVMYSYGLLYLPVSTYSLICATQLAFNAVFSYLFNSQKFTPLIFNSIVILTFSASPLAVRSNSKGSKEVSAANHVIGFLCTVCASAGLALRLSLTQLSLEKVLKKERFDVVLEIQFYTSAVTSCVAVIGLFASGGWRRLEGEMVGFDKGRVAYVMNLVWTAVAWQVCNVGMVGLIFEVSSLFTNVIGAVGLPIVPILAVVFFQDKMDGVKVVSLLMAVWGFLSYIYHHYLDDCKSKKTTTADASEVSDGASA